MEVIFGDNEKITLSFVDKNERIIGHLIKITSENADGIDSHISKHLLDSIASDLSSDTGSGIISGPAKDIAFLLKICDVFSADIVFDFGRHDFREASENYGFVTLVDGLYDRLPEMGVAEFTFCQLFETEQWQSIIYKLDEYVKLLSPIFGVINFENISTRS